MSYSFIFIFYINLCHSLLENFLLFSLFLYANEWKLIEDVYEIEGWQRLTPECWFADFPGDCLYLSLVRLREQCIHAVARIGGKYSWENKLEAPRPTRYTGCFIKFTSNLRSILSTNSRSIFSFAKIYAENKVARLIAQLRKFKYRLYKNW